MSLKQKQREKGSKKLRTGDEVIVIAGNSRGQKGKILRKEDDKVLVHGVNLRKKHVRKSEANPNGGIIDIEKPIHVSNVKLCVDDAGVKLKVAGDKNGNRELYYNSQGKKVTYREVKKPSK